MLRMADERAIWTKWVRIKERTLKAHARSFIKIDKIEKQLDKPLFRLFDSSYKDPFK